MISTHQLSQEYGSGSGKCPDLSASATCMCGCFALLDHQRQQYNDQGRGILPYGLPNSPHLLAPVSSLNITTKLGRQVVLPDGLSGNEAGHLEDHG
eukprot:1145046-Pelagomonas_calceolata.AAC.2